MASADPNRVLRQMPIVVGILAGTLLLVNRLMTADLTGSQSRSDALGVILSALLILTGLLWQRIQPRSPDAVVLTGTEGFELDEALPDDVRTELAWASHLLLTNTATRSLLVWYDNRILLRRGILGPKSLTQPGAIVQRALKTQKPIYLVKLQLYPGKIEFDYLPENTQGIICQPLGDRGILILGANAPRSYTRQDEIWIEGIADKLDNSLRSHLSLNPKEVSAEP
ncbi:MULTISPECIES: cofactor assembly of complex C subunit B [unclassified Leptolyngbya]|uniref:cofactor assembly of complex C subunit B n=1 Tax=unclassified Leptolyngbya TaxID=2650499 RepID=UPI0016872506|nr:MULTISPECIES: cofactor assembly of complex C subunit B [unclassified Leptolyngbya]MBD1909570.1 cofactor assembly of complex C subunit B [Leptolyngbya sp. FACHB-8]MBD2154108.1 cofactor assembly of complex C subunit B [Leptolyngbya sp. FACHB-16]